MAKGSDDRTPVIVVASSSSSESLGEQPLSPAAEETGEGKLAKKQVKKTVSFDPVARKKFVPHRDDDCGIDECHCTGGAPCTSRWYTKSDLASVKADVVETVTAAKTAREKRRRRRKLHRFDTELNDSDSDHDDVDDGRCLRGIEHLVDVGGPGHVPGSGVHAPGAARRHASAVLNEQFKQRRNKMLCGGAGITENEWATAFWSALARVSEGRTKEARDKAIKRGERDAAAARKIRSEATATATKTVADHQKDSGGRGLPFLWSRRAAPSSAHARIQIERAMAAGDGGGDGTSTAKGGGFFHKDKAKKKKKGHRFELELEASDLALDFTS